MLDNTRLSAELAHIHRTLAGVAAGDGGRNLVEELRRAAEGTTAALLWQALFADCLRVTYSALAADDCIGHDEIEAMYEFVFSVARRYAAVLPSTYGEFAAVDLEAAHAFLQRYDDDASAFGRAAPQHWPGLVLCRRAAEFGETEALERYERMMSWLITAACQIGGVTDADPRWRGRVDELIELRRELAHAAAVDPAAVDLRVQAFLAHSGVFAAVQQASSVDQDDPFDVESIHAEARASFEQMVERATDPDQHSDRGRILLVLGESGAGKTHLLRGFRRHVHEYGRGFVVYAQLHSASEDYSRYLLQHVVDSLARPYTGPSGERTGLHQLASGLPLLFGEALTAQVARLGEDNWDRADNLTDYVNRLVDSLLHHRELASFDPDLLRVLLYALHPDPRTTSRVYKYLRCEDMTAHDRKWIGDIAPRVAMGDPGKMVRELGRLAFVTRHATLVLMIDQAELAGLEASSTVAFRRAIDTLQSITTAVPSIIAVVACLSDFFTGVRHQLVKSAIDRLENDPPIVRLQINRSYDDIAAIVGRRLSWLFAKSGAVYRSETPVYPIPESRLRSLRNRRTRDILEWCHRFQSQCMDAGKIIESDEKSAIMDVNEHANEHVNGYEHANEHVNGYATIDANEHATVDPIEDAIVVAPAVDLDLGQIAAAWNDSVHAPAIEVPDDDDELLALVAAAGKACAAEMGLSLTAPPRKNGTLRLKLGAAASTTDLAIAVTNRSYRRGSFASQIELLRKSAKTATPVAIRTVEFPRGASSDDVIARLLKAGGRRAYLDASTLRTMVALQRFAPPFPADRIAAWRRRDRPVSSLPAIAHIFGVERSRDTDLLERAPPRAATAAGRAYAFLPTERAAPKPATSSHDPAAPAALAALAAISVEPVITSSLGIGTTSGFRAEPRSIELDSLLRHTGILGSSGSGKTTLALHLIEQVLERDVAVVLLDRKGDLAGYAKADWWHRTSDPARARRLAERLDVRLFTPGTRGGRPLSLPVIPDLSEVPEHERDRLVQYASQALAAMMRLGDAANDTARLAILTQAIAVLASRKARGGLAELIALLENRDDELIARAGRFDDRLFKRLLQELETVRLSDADLFDPRAEPLTAETLIGRRPDGRVPLAIVSTRFLGDVERIQSWVAHLIACLRRHAAKSPSSELHTLFMIDEADLYMPAGAAKPPSKEPLQDLLKRARAAGIGVVLASQSPADFDYRSREQISTWFLGRIADRRSIDKMKPLFEHRPEVGSKLANLEPGRFVMLQDGGAVDLERTPSLLRTEQLSEAQLMALAAKHRPREVRSR